MGDFPHVSVIIPTYNRRNQVLVAIASVLAQTYTHFEIIVVDDGSTDGTGRSDWPADTRIRFLQQPNKGVSAARNNGIQAATGELIALLDSDDEWMPEKLERQVSFFRTHPDALICQTEEIWIRNGRRANPKRKHEKKDGDIFKDSLELCLVSPSAVMMKKELLGEVGLFDTRLWACEDYDLWLRVACRYPIYLIREPLVIKYGGHADQLSAKLCLDGLRIQSLQKLLAEEPLSDRQRKEVENALVGKCRIYALGCKKHGKADEEAMCRSLIQEYGK